VERTGGGNRVAEQIGDRSWQKKKAVYLAGCRKGGLEKFTNHKGRAAKKGDNSWLSCLRGEVFEKGGGGSSGRALRRRIRREGCEKKGASFAKGYRNKKGTKKNACLRSNAKKKKKRSKSWVTEAFLRRKGAVVGEKMKSHSIVGGSVSGRLRRVNQFETEKKSRKAPKKRGLRHHSSQKWNLSRGL